MIRSYEDILKVQNFIIRETINIDEIYNNLVDVVRVGTETHQELLGNSNKLHTQSKAYKLNWEAVDISYRTWGNAFDFNIKVLRETIEELDKINVALSDLKKDKEGQDITVDDEELIKHIEETEARMDYKFEQYKVSQESVV